MRFINSKFKKETHEEKQLKENKENENAWIEFFYKVSEKGTPLDFLTIKTRGTEDYFKSLKFETNKAHIIRGNNGQGKSTLLKNIANATMGNLFQELSNKQLVVGSNHLKIGESLNGQSMNPYTLYSGDSIFSNKFDNSLSNTTHNVTWYCDFSTNYYKNSSGDTFTDIIQSVDAHSNGERKIVGINNIFKMLKLVSALECSKIKNGFDLFVIMDEPESGLSIELQEEFKNRVEHYLKNINAKISITFFIASHSFVWGNNKNSIIHNIKDFKNSKGKKGAYKNIFA